MKIEIWSDYACPFCYIGEARLRKAIDSLNARDKVTMEFRSFELDPYASREVESTTVERFAEKYRLSHEDAVARVESISAMGRAEGIDFRYAETRYTNTFDAHRLTKLAQSVGRTELIDKLFDAYFTRGLELSDHSVLKRLGVESGLEPTAVDEVLSSDRYSKEVLDDERRAMELGVHAVPFFLINEKYALSGAEPTEVIRDALLKIFSIE